MKHLLVFVLPPVSLGHHLRASSSSCVHLLESVATARFFFCCSSWHQNNISTAPRTGSLHSGYTTHHTRSHSYSVPTPRPYPGPTPSDTVLYNTGGVRAAFDFSIFLSQSIETGSKPTTLCRFLSRSTCMQRHVEMN